MENHYEALLFIARDYLGLSGTRFVKRVLQKIGASSVMVTRPEVQKFAKEISVAVGEWLTPEQKKEFKERVLALVN